LYLLFSHIQAQPLTFSAGPVVQLSLTAHPTDVAVADFNSDGRSDLAITEFGLDTLAIFNQRPNGVFLQRPDSRFHFPNGPVSVVALPLIHGPAGSPPPPADALAVYTGANVYFLDNFHNAQGTLTPRQFPQFYTSGYNSPIRKSRLFAARMDSDPYVDLAAFIDTTPHIIGGLVMTGTANGPRLVIPTMVTLPNEIPSMSLASFTKPGFLDAIVPDPVLNKVYVIPNLTGPSITGRWWSSFGIQDFPSGGIRPVSAAAADIDGDGWPDIAAAHATSRNVVISLLNQLVPTQITLSLPMVVPQQVELTDLNADGRPDVVVLTTDGTVWTYRNTGLPGTAAIDPQPTNNLAGTNPAYLRIADVNSDGRPDLLVPAIGNNTVSIFYNQSRPLAVAASQQLNLQVYPNPAMGEIHIQQQGNPVITSALLDAVGRPVRQWTMPADVLPVADLPRGLYLLRLKTAAGVVNKRVVLE
jgi:hypothetical protein